MVETDRGDAKPEALELDRATLRERLEELKFTDVEIIDVSEVGGGVWLVTTKFDLTSSWEGRLEHEGQQEAFEAAMQKAEAECEAANAEDSAEGTSGDDSDDWTPVNSLDARTCHERALEVLADDGVADGCSALEVVRVQGSTLEPLWSSVGHCDVDLQDVYTEDVAGVGWPQLVLVYSYSAYGVNRVGYGPTVDVVQLVVLDPLASGEEMFSAQLRWISTTEEAWVLDGGYAHVVADPSSRRLLVFKQSWATNGECETSALGWATPKEAAAAPDDGTFCEVEAETQEWVWEPERRRWTGPSPIDAPWPTRFEELEVLSTSARARAF